MCTKYCAVDEHARFRWLEDRACPEPNTGCWLWEGATDGAGRGRAYLGGRVVRAYRMAWELVNGPIPRGLCVCHKCDMPLCVNPDHLFLGTQKDNVEDMRRKGRYVNGMKQRYAETCRRGHPWTKDNTRNTKAGWRSCRACAHLLYVERRQHVQ